MRGASKHASFDHAEIQSSVEHGNLTGFHTFQRLCPAARRKRQKRYVVHARGIHWRLTYASCSRTIHVSSCYLRIIHRGENDDVPKRHWDSIGAALSDTIQVCVVFCLYICLVYFGFWRYAKARRVSFWNCHWKKQLLISFWTVYETWYATHTHITMYFLFARNSMEMSRVFTRDFNVPGGSGSKREIMAETSSFFPDLTVRIVPIYCLYALPRVRQRRFDDFQHYSFILFDKNIVDSATPVQVLHIVEDDDHWPCTWSSG